LAALTFFPAAVVAFLFDSLVLASAPWSTRLATNIGLCLVPLSVSWSLDVGTLVGSGQYRRVCLIRLITPALMIIVTPRLFVLDALDGATVVAMNIIGNVGAAIAGFILVGVPLRGDREDKATLLRESLPFAGNAILETASSRVDQVLALPLIGASAAGLYSVAVTVATLPQALATAMSARAFRVLATSGEDDRTSLVSTELREAASLAIAVAVALGLVAWPGVPLVFGNAYRGAIPALWCLLVGSVWLFMGSVASMLLAATSRGTAMTAAQFLSLTTDVLLLFALAPSLGTIGAAIAASAAYLVSLAAQVRSLGVGLSSLTPTPRAAKEALRKLLH
jgi:O-antigen/teichoic acid export membrane protein